jgi:hypothetical protein
MTWLFEVSYGPPSDPAREERIASVAARYGGRLVFRDDPEVDGSPNFHLTYWFETRASAECAADELRASGERVEEPYPYF